MINWNQIEREEAQIEQDLADGKLSPKEARRELMEIQRSIQAAAEEEAMDAYEKSMMDNGFR